MLCTNQEANGLGHCMKLNSQKIFPSSAKISMLKSFDWRFLYGDTCASNGDMHVNDTYSSAHVCLKKTKQIQNVCLSWMLYKMHYTRKHSLF